MTERKQGIDSQIQVIEKTLTSWDETFSSKVLANLQVQMPTMRQSLVDLESYDGRMYFQMIYR